MKLKRIAKEIYCHPSYTVKGGEVVDLEEKEAARLLNDFPRDWEVFTSPRKLKKEEGKEEIKIVERKKDKRISRARKK